jgi:antirestriction protein ArdC
MKKNENFIGDNAYLAPAMEMIEVETENSFASGENTAETGNNEDKSSYGGVAPLLDDFSDLLDF